MKTIRNIYIHIRIVFIISSILLTSCKEQSVESGSISGIITDAVSGEPIRSVSVSVTPGGFTTVTGNDGRYEFQVDANNYTLQFEKNGYVTNSKEITVIAGKNSNGDCKLTMVMPFSVNTLSVSKITPTSAQIEGSVTDSYPPVTERGFCYSTSSFPTINNLHVSTGSGSGGYSATLSDLAGSTTYYVRAYAINEIGIVYGDEIQFETPSTAIVSIDDYVALSDGIAFWFSPSTDTHIYYSWLYSPDELLENDNDIIQDLVAKGYMSVDKNDYWTWNTTYFENLKELTTYTLCMIAFDNQNKQGELVKKEFYTKTSNFQPVVEITVNSITTNGIYFDCTMNAYCTSYHVCLLENLEEDMMNNNYSDIWWIRNMGPDFKNDFTGTSNLTGVYYPFSYHGKYNVLITFGFNKDANSGVIGKYFFQR